MKVLKSVELSNQEAAWYLRTGRSRKIEYVNQQLKKPRLASDDRRKSKISNKRWRACGYVSWLRQTIRDLYLDSSSSFKYSKTHLWFNVFFRVLRTFFFFFLTRTGNVVYMCVKTVHLKFVYKRQLKQRVIITETRERARTKGFDTSKRLDGFRPHARTVTVRFARRTPKST